MFNIGGGEVLVIALIALIVVGPEQLPGVLRKAGRYANQFRSVTTSLRQEFMSGIDELDPTKWDGRGPGTNESPIVPRGLAGKPADTTPGAGIKPVSAPMDGVDPEPGAGAQPASANGATGSADDSSDESAAPASSNSIAAANSSANISATRAANDAAAKAQAEADAAVARAKAAHEAAAATGSGSTPAPSNAAPSNAEPATNPDDGSDV